VKLDALIDWQLKIPLINTDPSKITTRLDVNGWAWLVCGRSLFIWKHGGDMAKKSGLITCRELQLPPSELLHSAELVCVVHTKNASTPSAIAVNPEGLIHFWVNIANESSTVSINAEIPVSCKQGNQSRVSVVIPKGRDRDELLCNEIPRSMPFLLQCAQPPNKHNIMFDEQNRDVPSRPVQSRYDRDKKLHSGVISNQRVRVNQDLMSNLKSKFFFIGTGM